MEGNINSGIRHTKTKRVFLNTVATVRKKYNIFGNKTQKYLVYMSEWDGKGAICREGFLETLHLKSKEDLGQRKGNHLFLG